MHRMGTTTKGQSLPEILFVSLRQGCPTILSNSPVPARSFIALIVSRTAVPLIWAIMGILSVRLQPTLFTLL